MKHRRLRFSVRRYMQDRMERELRWIDRIIEQQTAEWKECQEAIWLYCERKQKGERT
jgi:hypothetical protein